MGRGEPGIVPSLTTQLVYFRQIIGIRQRAPGPSGTVLISTCLMHSNSGVLFRRSDIQVGRSAAHERAFRN
jgi:hypothetical protein